MDSFEEVVATLLERKGFWVRTSVKVSLTPDEKREIGRPSSPRWELDIVAYSGSRNELLVVECKSYLDSHGVRATSFDGPKVEDETRYKLFSDGVLRRVVLSRLENELAEQGFCPTDTKAKLCLAAGKIYGDPAALRLIFKKNGWGLFESSWLVEGLSTLADESYDNSVASVVAKLLLREERPERQGKGVRRKVLERERLEPEARRNVLMTALYLSRFGHEALGFGNQDQTFEAAAELLGTKKHTLKNHRDRFDPHTQSGRRGWWQADLPDDLRKLLGELAGLGEAELRLKVIRALGRKDPPEESSSATDESPGGRTTAPGFKNSNRQTVLDATGLPGTDHGQSVYTLLCDDCGEKYGANGSDIWLRKCPNCQGGRPGLPMQRRGLGAEVSDR